MDCGFLELLRQAEGLQVLNSMHDVLGLVFGLLDVLFDPVVFHGLFCSESLRRIQLDEVGDELDRAR